MDDVVENVCESLKLKRTYKKKVSISKRRRPYKNTIRKVRRKRSKVRYYKSLEQLRYNRKTKDLCSAVEVVDITDMEWAPSSSSTDLPAEVTEWQKQDQMAYWKSRAIALELENKMLHQHLRNVYAKTIEQYTQNKYAESNREDVQNQEETQRSTKSFRKKSGLLSDAKEPVNFKEPIGKNRLEEMKGIYGNKAQKIMGMETALQLNYEKCLDRSKASYWPSIPLHLQFD